MRKNLHQTREVDTENVPDAKSRLPGRKTTQIAFLADDDKKSLKMRYGDTLLSKHCNDYFVKVSSNSFLKLVTAEALSAISVFDL